MTTRARRLAAAATTTALLALGVGACAGGGDLGTAGDAGGGTAGDSSLGAPEAAAVEEAAPAEQPAMADGRGSDSKIGNTAVALDEQTTARAPELDPAGPRSLIRTGNVALRSTDVDSTLFEVRKVLQQTGGEVAEDHTQADDSGDAERSLLTVRVPVEAFEDALEALKVLGTAEAGVDLIDSSSASNDVSTQVIDTDVRVELQRRSIDRISILLDRASSIRDIVSIERELARREADLGSLQKRQAFLTDQTSLSTITISIERPKEKVVVERTVEGEEETGFLAGLTYGWDAFQEVTAGLLTGAGALLPFAILALLVGIPLRTWLHRRRPSVPHPATTATV